VKPAILHLSAPAVEFGDGDHDSIKHGLLLHGPYSLRLGPAHPDSTRVGIVGPRSAVTGAGDFVARCTGPLKSGRSNTALAPDFPGFEAVMRSRLVRTDPWDRVLSESAYSKAMSKPPRMAFKQVVRLYGDAIRELSEMDTGPDLVLCALPADLVKKCARIEQHPRPRRGKGGGRRPAKGRQSKQLDLFQHARGTVEAASQPGPDDLTVRDLRRALKAVAMKARMPIQLVTPNLFVDGARGQQDPATRAWNLSVALFYKAGGLPWRVKADAPYTCFVGLSFHHLWTSSSHTVFSSLAQAFSSEGDGFALRGSAVPWDEDRRQPYLEEEQAFELVEKVIRTYKSRVGREPLRVVIHKTTRYLDTEVRGISRALDRVPSVDLITIRSTDFRLLRQGTYPPHRGTLCTFGDATFLYTAGYTSTQQTYDGPHIPAPVEVISAQPHDDGATAREILGLTKMNWNSADDHVAFPISLQFARKVGLVMSEVPPDEEPHPSYRFYM